MNKVSRFLSGCVVLAVMIASVQAAPETYKIDPAHSTIGFKVKHFFTNVGGRFVDVTGTIKVDPEKPAEASVDATIKVATIDTANDKRDQHLESPDFFDASKFPEIVFKSKRVEVTGEKTANVIGDLTMRGVTKEVPLKVEFLGKGKGMNGEITGWQATTMLNRRDFGLTWGKMVEGVAAVGDEVEVELNIEAVKAE